MRAIRLPGRFTAALCWLLLALSRPLAAAVDFDSGCLARLFAEITYPIAGPRT